MIGSSDGRHQYGGEIYYAVIIGLLCVVYGSTLAVMVSIFSCRNLIKVDPTQRLNGVKG